MIYGLHILVPVMSKCQHHIIYIKLSLLLFEYSVPAGSALRVHIQILGY